MPRRPAFRLLYAGVDITADLALLTLSISYVDKLEGASDELTIHLVNHSDRLWLDTWLPGEGDCVSLELGYEGEALLGPVKSVQTNQVYEVGSHWAISSYIAANLILDDVLKYGVG